MDPQALRRQVRALLRGLDRMRPSEAYGYVGGMVGAVSELLGQAERLIEAGDGRGALTVVEAVTEEFLAGWEMLDDSDGYASAFFRVLGEAWTDALLTADPTLRNVGRGSRSWRLWQGRAGRLWHRRPFDPALSAAVQGWDYRPL